MSKLRYKPKELLPLIELRDAKIDILLKNKKIDLYCFNGVENNSKEFLERMEVFNYYYSKGIRDNEIKVIWMGIKPYRSNKDYNKMPKRERKDNQNPKTETINYGSGYGNGSWLRVPSKKHKNRYKNFLKLFPWYKEK